MSDTVTIVEFLTARLDEDEQAARPASGPEWEATDETGHAWRFDAAGVYVVDENQAESRWALVAPAPHQADRVHIARHDPARVLAEVAAKRAIVELHGLHPNCHADIDGPDYLICAVCHDYSRHDAARWPCATLRALALPYADHRTYREEWKP